MWSFPWTFHLQNAVLLGESCLGLPSSTIPINNFHFSISRKRLTPRAKSSNLKLTRQNQLTFHGSLGGEQRLTTEFNSQRGKMGNPKPSGQNYWGTLPNGSVSPKVAWLRVMATCSGGYWKCHIFKRLFYNVAEYQISLGRQLYPQASS